MEIGCVILASGESVRFGSNKLLADFRGKPLLMRLLDALPASLNAVVVTRSDGVQRLAQERGYRCLWHRLPEVRDTIRLGLMEMPETDGCLFCVGDQPFLNAKTLRRMAEAFDEHPRQILRAAAGEQMGNPVLFPAALFGELCALVGEQSGSAVLRAHRELVLPVQVEAERELFDVDTQADYERLSRL